MKPTHTHEDFTPRTRQRGGSDRSFGFVFAAFFLLIALAPLRTHHSVRQWAFAPAVALVIVAVLRPHWLSSLNRLWTKLGLLMGHIVTPVVTALLFFVVVTPTALLLRLLGKDPLQRASVFEADSYWIERRPPGPPPESMVNQF